MEFDGLKLGLKFKKKKDLTQATKLQLITYTFEEKKNQGVTCSPTPSALLSISAEDKEKKMKNMGFQG